MPNSLPQPGKRTKGDNTASVPAIIAGETSPESHLEGNQMARRRYQRGSLRLRGKVWYGQWREDVLAPDETISRVKKQEALGHLKQYPTRRLAVRRLEERLSQVKVNSLDYRPTPTATFAQFAGIWQRDTLSQHKPSTQSADRSRLHKHLLPELGHLPMKEITRDVVQGFIARKAKSLSSKSVKNCIALLGEMWQVAKVGGYTQIDPFVALRLPEPELLDEPALSIEEMKLIIDSAPEPFKTFCWILAETGIRCGEACALPVSNILVDLGAIRITQSTWQQTIQTVKSKKGNRLCEISPQLTEHLRAYLRSWRPNRLGLLFVTKNGTPWDQNTVRRRKLYPLLAKLRIEKCGFHAFRHGNETVMDSQNVPMATRVNRLGHSNVQTTMRYTHVVSEDGRQIAATLGKLLTSRAMLAPAGNA